MQFGERSLEAKEPTSSSKTSPAGGDGYTAEQHLVAAIKELRRQETANQTYLERMLIAMSSPFKITTKPCDAERTATLKCYERLLQPSEGRSSGSAPLAVSAGEQQDMWKLPLYQCYEPALVYQRCVEHDTLSQHLALVALFEERSKREKVVFEASEAAASAGGPTTQSGLV